MMVGHWFLSAYLVLMLVSPLLNDMCSRFAKGDVFAAMCFGALLLWSWCRSLPILSTLLPSSPGLGEYTALSLAGVYAFARIVRLLGLDRRLSTGALIGVVVAMAPLCCLGYGGYSSFFAMLMAGATFLLLERWEMAWRWVFWVSPSMFALLLISQKAGFTYPYYNAWQRHFIDGMGWNAFAVCLGMAAVSFLLCLALDVPRRLSAWLARPLAVKCYGWMDGLFEKVCINISAWIERHSGGAR